MTPQAPPPPAAQGSWFARNKVLAIAGGCFVLVACCGSSALLAVIFSQPLGNGSARVDCGTPGPGGVDCEVVRTSGGGGLRPCWVLEITCQNGGLMRANACGTLGEGVDQVTVTMPASSFSNQSGCDAPKSGAVKELIVNPQ